MPNKYPYSHFTKKGGQFYFFDWMGWDNLNTCVFNYYNTHFNGFHGDRKETAYNIGITVLPLRFWEHIHFEIYPIGNTKRICIGIGFLSFFMDF